MIYFVEEPETHLHPSLIRRFMALIEGITSVQFFISTHSSVILNALGDGDKVFHFGRDHSGNCFAVACDQFIERHNALDRLGFNGGALLQTNSVIWVEGPSDRLYVRHWLTEMSAFTGERLQEGSDYCFCFYGGKVLSHFDLESEDDDESNVRELISMVEVSRFSAVIMDRDVEPGSKDSIRTAKERIVESAKKDPTHRLALITEGREIENDVNIEAFRKALQSLPSLKDSDLTAFTPKGKSPYWQELKDFLASRNKQIQLPKSADKVRIAESVITQKIDDPSALPSWLLDLYEFVIRARVE